MSGVLFLDRLTEADLALLSEAAGESGRAADRVRRLRADPDRIPSLLDRPEVFDALFGPRQRDPLVVVAPFLAFAVLLARTNHALAEVSFVREWVGPRQRVPVFDVQGLRQFLADPPRRFFLAELLASYTHVASGSVWMKTRRGWRGRRFSELDPVRLAEIIEAVSEHERVALYRRLGDLALFLTGVFPDYTSRRVFGPVGRGHLKRAVHDPGPGRFPRAIRRPGPPEAEEEFQGLDDPIRLLEWLGRRSYRLAWEATEPRDVGLARVVGEVAERFGEARRILNFLTERYLFPHRQHWFPPAAA